MPSLFLVHWDPEEATAWAEEIADAGWEVEVESERADMAYRNIREAAPEVVVIDLDLKPDYGVRAADAIHRSRWGQEVRFVFIGGEDEDALLTLREDLPDAVFIEREDLMAALGSLHG